MGFLPQREYDIAEFNMVKKYFTGKICAPRNKSAKNYSTTILKNHPGKIKLFSPINFNVLAKMVEENSPPGI